MFIGVTCAAAEAGGRARAERRRGPICRIWQVGTKNRPNVVSEQDGHTHLSGYEPYPETLLIFNAPGLKPGMQAFDVQQSNNSGQHTSSLLNYLLVMFPQISFACHSYCCTVSDPRPLHFIKTFKYIIKYICKCSFLLYCLYFKYI